MEITAAEMKVNVEKVPMLMNFQNDDGNGNGDGNSTKKFFENWLVVLFSENYSELRLSCWNCR